MSWARSTFLVATGCSSGLGLHTLAHLLAHPTPSTPTIVLIGTRAPLTQEAITLLDAAKDNRSGMSYEQIPLDLASLSSAREFAQAVKVRVGEGTIGRVLLNAAVWGAKGQGAGGWVEEAIVNHFSQHYLLQLLLPLLRPHGDTLPRVVFTSSGLQNRIKSLDQLERLLKAPSSGGAQDVYGASKLVAIAGARGWQERLEGRVELVAVSPGLVPTTGLSRTAPWLARMAMLYLAPFLPFCTSLESGAAGIAYALTLTSPDLDALERPSGPEGERRLVYLDPKHNLREVNALVEEGGEELWKGWMPSVEEMERWQ